MSDTCGPRNESVGALGKHLGILEYLFYQRYCQRCPLKHDPAVMPRMLRLAVPDMVSNTFFPVLAAVDLGFFHDEGVDASIELLPPESKLFAALREGELDFVAGSAHPTLSAFPDWRRTKLLAAVRQHLPWLLYRANGAPCRQR